MMLAAYMFVKRASNYVAAPADGAAVTRGPIDAFMAPRAAARALEIPSNGTTAPAAATTTITVVAVDTADSDNESEPDLQAVTHTTRPGRRVRALRAVDAVNRIIPGGVTLPGGRGGRARTRRARLEDDDEEVNE